MSFVIREAIENDAVSIGIVYTESWKSAYKGMIPDEYLNQLDSEKRAERFKRDLVEYKNTYYYIAESDGKVIGVLALHKSRDLDLEQAGEINSIYLLPGYWNKGFGKQMMAFAVEKLKKLGFSLISLWVLEDNQRAKAFYEKSGFIKDGKKQEFTIMKPVIVTRYIYKIEE